MIVSQPVGGTDQIEDHPQLLLVTPHLDSYVWPWLSEGAVLGMLNWGPGWERSNCLCPMARGPSGRKHVAQKCNLGGGQSVLPDPWVVVHRGGHLSVTWAGVEWRGCKEVATQTQVVTQSPGRSEEPADSRPKGRGWNQPQLEHSRPLKYSWFHTPESQLSIQVVLRFAQWLSFLGGHLHFHLPRSKAHGEGGTIWVGPTGFFLGARNFSLFKGAQVLLESDESYGVFPQKNAHSYNKLYTIWRITSIIKTNPQ